MTPFRTPPEVVRIWGPSEMTHFGVQKGQNPVFFLPWNAYGKKTFRKNQPNYESLTLFGCPFLPRRSLSPPDQRGGRDGGAFQVPCSKEGPPGPWHIRY